VTSPELIERVLLHILLDGLRFVAAVGGAKGSIAVTTYAGKRRKQPSPLIILITALAFSRDIHMPVAWR